METDFDPAAWRSTRRARFAFTCAACGAAVPAGGRKYLRPFAHDPICGPCYDRRLAAVAASLEAEGGS